jgi:Domain of unknown function (DUF4177)
MVKWEYQFAVISLDPNAWVGEESQMLAKSKQTLDAQGEQGWEAVSLVPMVGPLGAISEATVLMKRSRTDVTPGA